MTVRDVLGAVSVEPCLCLFMLSSYLQFPVYQSLVYDRVCYKLVTNQSHCQELHEYKDEESQVHAEASTWLLYNSVLITLPAAFTALILGSWSDRGRGRQRYSLLFPLVTTLVANIYLSMESSRQGHVGMLLIASALIGIGGGMVAVLMGCFSFLSLIVNPSNRSVRVAAVEASSYIGAMLGLFFNGILLDGAGYSLTFGVAAGVSGLAVLSSIRLHFLCPTIEVTESNASPTLCDKLGFTLWKEAFICVFRARENGKRPIVLLLLPAFLIYIIANAAEIDLGLLFLKHSPLDWKQTEIGIYDGCLLALKVLGLMVVLRISRRFLGTYDVTHALLGLLALAVHLLVFAFSRHSYVVFLSLLPAWAMGFAPASLRAILASIVECNEQGRAFAALGTIEGLGMLLAGVIWNPVYKATEERSLGLVFYTAAGSVCLIAIPIVLSIRILMKRKGLLPAVGQTEVNYETLADPTTDQ